MLRLVFGLLALMPLQLWASDLVEQIQEGEREYCSLHVEIATYIMTAHQLGEEQDAMIIAAADSDLEIMEILNKAKESPVFDTEEERLSAVNGFRRQTYANCMNHPSRYSR